MALKSDQQRVMGLLKDTITLLCKNGLTFETKFAIDAVIGVTIDEKDLFYLSMNEIVKSDAAPPDSSTKTGVARIEQSDSDGQLSGEEAHTASGKKRRKRKRPVKQEESGSDGENGIQSDGGGSDDADVSRLEDSGSGIPSPRKKSNIKVESGGDDDADIVFVKQELDDSWSQSIAQDGENSSYQGYPNTSMSQSDFSQDPNFSADNSLVAMGLANDSGMWAQNVGGSPGQPRPFRPRGPRSFTATTPGQQADGDGQLTGQDNLQADADEEMVNQGDRDVKPVILLYHYRQPPTQSINETASEDQTGGEELINDDDAQDPIHTNDDNVMDDDVRVDGDVDTDDYDDDDGDDDNDEISSNSRFGNELDVESFIEAQKNSSTDRKTRQHMRLLDQYLSFKKERRPVHEIPPSELNEYLSSFFVNLTREPQPSTSQDIKTDYEPCTIKSIQSSISRHLKEHRYALSIMTSEEFQKSRQAIAAKCKLLRKNGMGSRPNRKRALTDEELTQMWREKALGDSSPQSLQHTMWWIMTTRFGLHENKQNLALRWGDLEVKEDQGLEYLTKKVTPVENPAEVQQEIRVYEDQEQPLYCPVRLFKLYAMKRPESMKLPESRFYLQPKSFGTEASMSSQQTWYKTQVHGINSIKRYMREICKKAGIQDSKLSNISAKKHLVSIYRKPAVLDATRIQVPVHQRLETIPAYAYLVDEGNMAVGSILEQPSTNS